MTGVFCNNCGHKNPDGSNFCSSCGHVLEHAAGEPTTITFAAIDQADADEDHAVTFPDLPEDTGMLIVRKGPNAGSRYTLESAVVGAGRHPESEIFLDDITVSRRHAEFFKESGVYHVRDVGSLNGTYLNRDRIEKAPLANGDEVQIGRFKLVFLAGPGGAG
ncbi:MAG: FHA domain-containing protein [Acidimicrobiales bacterium]